MLHLQFPFDPSMLVHALQFMFLFNLNLNQSRILWRVFHLSSYKRQTVLMDIFPITNFPLSQLSFQIENKKKYLRLLCIGFIMFTTIFPRPGPHASSFLTLFPHTKVTFSTFLYDSFLWLSNFYFLHVTKMSKLTSVKINSVERHRTRRENENRSWTFRLSATNPSLTLSLPSLRKNHTQHHVHMRWKNYPKRKSFLLSRQHHVEFYAATKQHQQHRSALFRLQRFVISFFLYVTILIIHFCATCLAQIQVKFLHSFQYVSLLCRFAFSFQLSAPNQGELTYA